MQSLRHGSFLTYFKLSGPGLTRPRSSFVLRIFHPQPKHTTCLIINHTSDEGVDGIASERSDGNTFYQRCPFHRDPPRRVELLEVGIRTRRDPEGQLVKGGTKTVTDYARIIISGAPVGHGRIDDQPVRDIGPPVDRTQTS